MLRRPETQAEFKTESDYAGHCQLAGLPAGGYELRVEKEGFYALAKQDVRVGETESLEVTLNHLQEYRESVNVVASPPGIDPAKTTSSEKLTSREIIDLPYTVTRDIRYALPLLPGVLQDGFGQVHFDGSSTRQINDQLDGFNITDPVSGLFDVRVSVDALRSVEVQTSRYPAEYGKGSGGILSLMSGMGDDHARFAATDLPPSLQNRRGIHVNTWTPRATLSGPLKKGKVWFLDALEGEYAQDILTELPAGADRNSVSRFNNLAKTQVNLTQSNILTTSFLANALHSPHVGLSPFDPLQTTVALNDTAYLVTTKDQAYLPNGVLFEIGVGFSRFRDSLRPEGTLPYVITPEGKSGNFFEAEAGRADRLQGIASLILPPARRGGRHVFKLGTDLDQITYTQSFARRPISILREDRTLSRRVTFLGNPPFTKINAEVGGYAQDHWALSERLLVDYGTRLDWDQVLRRLLVSPRLASSFLATASGSTKIVWGVGQYYDATNLQFITSVLTGQRMDFFYDSTGQTLVRPPVETSFQVDEHSLKEPRFTNWSAGVERKLGGSTTLKLEYVQKRGHNGWAYVNLPATTPGALNGQFELRNVRRDRYDALGVTVRRAFRGDHIVFASYTRSAACSSAVLNFNLENPLFSQQAGGPLPWDSPNRLLSWGWLPLSRKFDLAYTLDWRDGFPFNLFNQDQQLVGTPGARRFPTYFSLNAALETRFHLMGFQWALRAGFDDITDRHNPSFVNSNVDSPKFLTFGGFQTRALTARIRMLGRK